MCINAVNIDICCLFAKIVSCVFGPGMHKFRRSQARYWVQFVHLDKYLIWKHFRIGTAERRIRAARCSDTEGINSPRMFISKLIFAVEDLGQKVDFIVSSSKSKVALNHRAAHGAVELQYKSFCLVFWQEVSCRSISGHWYHCLPVCCSYLVALWSQNGKLTKHKLVKHIRCHVHHGHSM